MISFLCIVAFHELSGDEIKFAEQKNRRQTLIFNFSRPRKIRMCCVEKREMSYNEISLCKR